MIWETFRLQMTNGNWSTLGYLHKQLASYNSVNLSILMATAAKSTDA